MGSSPIFTEVIDVTLNSDSLEASLNALIDMYKGKLDEMSNAGTDANTLSPINVAAISADIASVRGELQGLTSAFMESFASVQSASVETSKTLATTLATAMNEVDGTAKASTKSQLESLSLLASGSEEAWGVFAQAAQTALTDGFDPRVRMTADLTNNLFTVIANGGREAFAELTAQQQDWVVGYQAGLAKIEDAVTLATEKNADAWTQSQQKQIAEQENATRMMEADMKKRADSSLFYEVGSDEFQRFQMKQVADQESATRLMEADMKKRADASLFYDADGDEFQRIQMKQVADQESATRLMETDMKKRADSSLFYEAGSDEFQRFQMKQVADQESATRLMEADLKKRADSSLFYEAGSDEFQRFQMKQVAEQENATRLMEADMKKRADASLFYEAGSDEFQRIQMKQVAEVEEATRLMEADFAKRKAAADAAAGFDVGAHLTSEIASLGTMLIEWAAIGEVIELCTKTVEAFFGTFSNGLKYLEDMETRSAALQGVLASNVKFSSDMAENFQLAGVASQNINKEIQDYSIKYGVAIDVLTRGFKSFVEAGGTSLVHSTDEALEAATLLSVAIKASGKDAETTRAALSEIPKLLDGTITSTSKILETLGLSTVEWKAMLAQAKSHKDLLDQINARMQNYKQVAEDSQSRFGAIESVLGLIYDRTTGLMAQQFWPVLKADLQIIRDFLNANKTAIDACATAIGEFVSEALKLSDTKAMMGTLLTAFQTFAIFLVLIKQSFVELNAQAGQFFYLMKLGVSFSIKDMEDSVAKIKELQKTFDEAQPNAKAQIQLILHPPEPAAPVATPDGDGKPPPDNTKPTSDAVQALKAQYKDLSEQVKIAADKEKEGIQENLAARNISIQTATRLTIEAGQVEFEAQQVLIQKTKDALANTAGPAKTKNAFGSSLDQDALKDQQANDKTVAAAQKQATVDALAQQDQGDKDMEAALKESKAAQLAIIQGNVKSSLLSVTKGIDEELAVRKAALQSELAIYGDEYEAAGADVTKQNAALAKMSAAEAAYTAASVESANQRKTAQLNEVLEYNAQITAQSKATYDAAAAAVEANHRVSTTSLETKTAIDNLAKAKLAMASADVVNMQMAEIFARELGITGKQLDEVREKIIKLNAEKITAAATADKDTKAVDNSDPVVAALKDAYGEWRDLFQAFGGNLKDFGTQLSQTMNATTGVITAATTAFTNIYKAIQEGGGQGVAAGLGAAGSAASSASSSIGNAVKDGGSLVNSLSDSMKSLFANAGVVGSLMSAASGLVSIITSLFTAAAQRIADNINKAFKNTMASYDNGEATLSATLAAVQEEKQDAIAQLSGVKGGQSQLDKLLPTLDAEIATLQAQQLQIITDFNTQTTQLQMHSTILSQTLTTWDAINTAVTTYIAAGGSAATAAAYISESLLAIKNDAASNLSEGQETAINEAIQYNNLLVQRQQLTDAYNKSRFETLNADALERRTSNAVSVGQSQNAANATYQASLTDLNQQITTAATEVSMYKQIYTIASDTATLKAQAAAIDIANLATQIQSLKDYQTVYNSIYQKPDGSYGTSNGAGTNGTGAANSPAPATAAATAAAATTTNVVTVNVTVPAGSDGTAIANSIQSELVRNGRYGYGSSYSSN